IYVDYDESKNPYFMLIVEEALAQIAKKPIGKKLLDAIKATNPPGQEPYLVAIYSAAGTRGPGEAEFVDVRFTSTRDAMGMKPGGAMAGAWQGMEKKGGVGSVAAAANRTAAETGKGSRYRLRYNDKDLYVAQKNGKNIQLPAFIPLAHELIHALHG